MNRLFILLFCLIILFPVSLTAQKFQKHPHPFYYKEIRVNNARQNMDKYEWAQRVYSEIKVNADEAASISDDKLRKWISDHSTTRVCDCPNCKTSWLGYIWEWDPQSPETIVCRICKKPSSIKIFPENSNILLTDPQGKEHKHPVFKNSDGKIFQLRARINYQKLQHIQKWIEDLGAVYAITEDPRYAHKAAVLIYRLAEVLPGYALHDWERHGTVPWSRAGKISGWNYQDAILITVCGKTYDIIYNSDILGNKEKAFIEKNLFHNSAEYLTAVSPFSGITNDIPFRFAGVAMIGRTLEDHKILEWVLNQNEGLSEFTASHFFRDGHWYERSPSYHKMAVKNFHHIVDILQGYSDPENYKESDRYVNIDLKSIPKIENIYSCLFKAVYPDGSLPPINDSHVHETPPASLAEVGYSWFGGIKWLSILSKAYNGNLNKNGDLYALFNRNPKAEDEAAALYSFTEPPLKSMDFDGLGMAMLRMGTGKNQAAFTMKYGKYTSDHGHFDALGITLFAKGKEMLSDLGYPYWSHRYRGQWMRRSLAHNTITVDMLNQDAAGELIRFFYSGKTFSAFDTEIRNAYQLTMENFVRQIALIRVNKNDVYAVDLFRVKGGNVHDWSLHSEAPDCEVYDIDLHPETELYGFDYAYKYISDVNMGNTSGKWAVEWKWNDGTALYCHMLGQPDCEVYKTRAPGERLIRGDTGRKIDYIFNRRKGEKLKSEFIAVYEPYSGNKFIKNVTKFSFQDDKNWAIVLKIELNGRTDYVLTSYLTANKEPFTDRNIKIEWKNRFGLVSVMNEKIISEEWIN